MSVSERAPRRGGGDPSASRAIVLLAPPPLPPAVSFAPRDQVIARCPGCRHVFWTFNTLERHCSLKCASGGQADGG